MKLFGRKISIIAIFFLCLNFPIWAQLEFSYSKGKMWGGIISFYREDIDVANGPNRTLQLSIGSNNLFYEFSYTTFESVGTWRRSSTPFDIDIKYYQLGTLWQLGDPHFCPFVATSIGAANYNPNNPENNYKWFFGATTSLGVKIFVSHFVGIRFQARLLSPIFSKTEWDEYSYNYNYSSSYYHESYSVYKPYAIQGDLSIGLIIRLM